MRPPRVEFWHPENQRSWPHPTPPVPGGHAHAQKSPPKPHTGEAFGSISWHVCPPVQPLSSMHWAWTLEAHAATRRKRKRNSATRVTQPGDIRMTERRTPTVCSKINKRDRLLSRFPWNSWMQCGGTSSTWKLPSSGTHKSYFQPIMGSTLSGLATVAVPPITAPINLSFEHVREIYTWPQREKVMGPWTYLVSELMSRLK